VARIFTLGALVTKCQQQLDMESEDAVDTDEYKGRISTAYAELASILVSSGLRYFEDEQSFAATSLADDGAGGGSIALPADYLATIGVDRQVGERWCQLDELMVQERNTFSSSRRSAQAWTTIGQKLHLYPRPPASDAYRHLYVPQPADLSAEDDETDVDVVTPDGEAFIVWSVAVALSVRDETDARDAMAERERARARVEKWAVLRSFNTPRRRVIREGPFFDGADDPASWRYR
jgi:hypothetical protein